MITLLEKGLQPTNHCHPLLLVMGYTPSCGGVLGRLQTPQELAWTSESEEGLLLAPVSSDLAFLTGRLSVRGHLPTRQPQLRRGMYPMYRLGFA